MGLFARTKQTARTNRKPTMRERRAAERTAKAEASLVQTEQKIHQIADEARSDLKRQWGRYSSAWRSRNS